MNGPARVVTRMPGEGIEEGTLEGMPRKSERSGFGVWTSERHAKAAQLGTEIVYYSDEEGDVKAVDKYVAETTVKFNESTGTSRFNGNTALLV